MNLTQTNENEKNEENEENEEKSSNFLPFFCMGLFLVSVQILSIILAQPMIDEGMQFSDDPKNVWLSVYYIGIILIFTLFILIAMKRNMKWIIHGFILFSVAVTLYYVFYAIFAIYLDEFTNIVLSSVLCLFLTIAMYKFPEWYVIDLIGILIGAGVTALFGISFGILPTLVLLILLAIYDAVSVYRTKHMLTLAEGVMDMKVPILFIIPNNLKFSYRDYKYNSQKEREAFFMGLGDAIMPTILVVSANVFIAEAYMQIPLIGALNIPALGAAVGTVIGFAVLMVLVARGKPQAGLPFLNTGAIFGYVIGCLSAGVSIIPL
jgi:presenilin-like A22 family membrane protease